MIYGLRKRAAKHIEELRRNEGKKPYAYNTIYYGLQWNSITDSYYFDAEDDRYSFSLSDIS